MTQLTWKPIPIPNFSGLAQALESTRRGRESATSQITTGIEGIIKSFTSAQKEKEQNSIDALKSSLLSSNRENLQSTYDNLDRSGLDGSASLQLAKAFNQQRQLLNPTNKRNIFEYGAGNNQKTKGYFDNAGDIQNIGSPYDSRKGQSIKINTGNQSNSLPPLLNGEQLEKYGYQADDRVTWNAKKGFEVVESPSQAKINIANAKDQSDRVNGFNAYRTKSADRLAQFDDSSKLIDGLIEDTGYTTAGMANLAAGIPATPMKDYASTMATLVSRLGFDELMSMKDASATGASGLGQLSNTELEFLQNYKVNLDPTQSPNELRGKLEYIQNIINRNSSNLEGEVNAEGNFFNQHRGDGSEEYTPYATREQVQLSPLQIKQERIKELEAMGVK